MRRRRHVIVQDIPMSERSMRDGQFIRQSQMELALETLMIAATVGLASTAAVAVAFLLVS